ncbi:MAG: hypothetical protein NZ602_08260 [Thermoguttaceae bacterium]|nr:hypothetical protein [Thermoguttaceae bacterium]
MAKVQLRGCTGIGMLAGSNGFWPIGAPSTLLKNRVLEIFMPLRREIFFHHGKCFSGKALSSTFAFLASCQKLAVVHIVVPRLGDHVRQISKARSKAENG